MASNRLPDRAEKLFLLAADMADGLHTLEAAVAVKQNTEAAVRADLDAARDARAVFQGTRGGKATLNAAVTLADSNAKAFLADAATVLAKHLGNDWNQRWLPTGFPNQSTGVPRTVAARESLLGSLADYFAAHAGQELVAGPFNVSAARAGTLHAALSRARANLANAARTTSAQAKRVRDDTEDALRLRMRGLVNELTQLLPDDLDARWYAFGLNRPGDPETPGVPDSLTLVPGAPGSGRLYADWADARRAGRYRVWVLVVGTDADFRPAATVEESDATLPGLPLGATVRVRVTAANDAGESEASETVVAVVG